MAGFCLALQELSSRFAAKCEALSDCKSATNKPNADLGWVFEGQFGREFDAVAFDLEARVETFIGHLNSLR